MFDVKQHWMQNTDILLKLQRKKRAKISLTISFPEESDKDILVCLVAKASKSLLSWKKKKQFISTLQWLHGNTLISTYKNVSGIEKKIIPHFLIKQNFLVFNSCFFMGFFFLFLDISLLSGKKRAWILQITADFSNISLKRVCTLLHKTLVFLHILLFSPDKAVT